MKIKLFIFIVLLLYWSIFFVFSIETPAEEQKSIVTDVFDAHVHAGFEIKNGKVVYIDSDYLDNRGIRGFVYPLPVDRSETGDLLKRILSEFHQIKEICQMDSCLNLVIDTESVRKPDKLNVYLGIEYFHGVFRGDPEIIIKKYKQLGIRYITLIHGKEDRLFNERDELNNFGKKIIRTMNQERMRIDISHLNPLRALSVIRQSYRPVLVSHAGNLTDKVLKALGDTGGFVMLSFNTSGLTGKGNLKKGVPALISKLDHFKKYIKLRNIGIGSDYQAEGKYVPLDLNMPDTFVQIKNEMKKAGFQDNEIEDFLKGIVNVCLFPVDLKEE